MAPYVLLDAEKDYMVLLYRDAYKSIEELSQEELRLGGLRIDPKTNIGSRVNYFNNLEIKALQEKDAVIKVVEGLPENPRLANFTWSPDQKKLAVTNTTTEGVEVMGRRFAKFFSNQINRCKCECKYGRCYQLVRR